MEVMLKAAQSPDRLLWFALFFVGVSVVSVALGFLLERALPRKRIWAVPLDRGQLRHELIGNAVFLAVLIATFSAAFAVDLVRLGPESWVRGLLTFAALSFGFQIFYYGLHRLMHLRAFVRVHRWHHASRVTTPLSGQSMSAVEALGWVLGYIGLPFLFSQLVPISFAGWLGYIAFNIFGNIVGHANVELEPRSGALRVKSLFTNAIVYHALHHARWTGHYGFAAALMDRTFGTEWPDWLELHARIASGQPLTSLRERGPSASSPAAAEPIGR